jgi:predicted ATP-grasp superfamily ATP-dependent carboligase
MAQAFVPGPVASCQVVFDQGHPLAWATSYKARTWPGPYGPSSAVTFAPIAGVAELLPLIGEALGFHGALTVDLIVDERSRRPVVIEVNVRPAGIMSRGRRAGVDFAAAVRQMLFGIPSRTHTRGTRRSFTAGLYPQDLVRCFENGEFAPLRDWFAAATLADLPWTDPAVFLSSTRFLLSHLVRRS